MLKDLLKNISGEGIDMNKYVQAPISRIPSGDLQSSGMSFMQGGAALTGGALGSDPRTYAPRGGAVIRRDPKPYQPPPGAMSFKDMRADFKRNPAKYTSGRPKMRGKGSCGGAVCKSCGCHGRGMYA